MFDCSRKIYFVAETKDSTEEKDLREIEKLKIHCAREHFKAISGTDIKFDVVKDFQKLSEIVQVCKLMILFDNEIYDLSS
jgi:type III restriction enzyme